MKKNAEDIITSSKNIPKSSSRKRPRHELRTDDVNNLVNTETGQVHIRSMRQECALNEKPTSKYDMISQIVEENTDVRNLLFSGLSLFSEVAYLLG